MHAPANPFKARNSATRVIETGAFWFFRLATYLVLLCAAFIFGYIFWKGCGAIFKSSAPFVNWSFLTQPPETLHVFSYQGRHMELGDAAYRAFAGTHNAKDITGEESYVYCAGGIGPCIVGTVLLVIGSMVIALLLGVFSAIYLSEYSKQGPVVKLIRLAILNLAGVPSIVFGLFGAGLFVLFLGWNACLLSGWFTLAFMVLPVIIAASEESLKAVPQGFREGSLALGATKWQAIRTNVLPYAFPGILTSSVLGIARVAGETAPIMFTAAYANLDQLPWSGVQFLHPSTWGSFFFRGVMALPYHIYVLSLKLPNNEYTARTQYGTAFVFLFIVSILALTSIFMRIKVRSRYKW
ncbi:MAG TPA: phosphate ABC transporter permease PstA [Chthoniobacteraceae bacterium]|nr:phosphate ABC transporter permease PstA [Chthoniobacteraceae bacterium]